MAGQKMLIKKVLLVWGEIARGLPGVSSSCVVWCLLCSPFRYAFYYYLSVAPLRITTLDQRIHQRIRSNPYRKMLGGVHQYSGRYNIFMNLI
ncbi:hypothetical protein GLYMA_01G175700v4 [Glycine max]|uniref:Uncharacterized protein n=1 Tax=Glycine max TaxID=3847 RepID=K7K4E4_SOYBN|nr:hypothetical protein GYH30_001911 [Glycine max]KRH76809.1 hypothetical protein GLYMA_01G175700v4 [Glycine max]